MILAGKPGSTLKKGPATLPGLFYDPAKTNEGKTRVKPATLPGRFIHKHTIFLTFLPTLGLQGFSRATFAGKR
jgi:hypothetical protein